MHSLEKFVFVNKTFPMQHKNCIYPEWEQGLEKSLWTPHIQHTPSLNCYHLVDATELWAPERPDNGTFSSLKQSSHLTINVEHTTLSCNYLFITHTYYLQICTTDLYTHNCLYYIWCFCYFVHCLFVYLYIILLLSVSCPVAVILLQRVASVTITHSLYV